MKNNHLSYRSGNPVLTSDAFNLTSDSSDVMTINGTVTKTFLSLCLVVISGYYSWINISITNVLILPAIFVALILGGVTIYKKHLSPITVPIYAVIQGIFLGAISYTFNSLYDGIVITAISYTLSILFVMLTLYRTGIIKPTENFKLGVAAGTGGIAIIYLSNLRQIGRWSAEMILLFTFNRPNIWPIQDIGLLRAISKNYKKKYLPPERFIKELKKKFSPYCSVATWYLWRSIDPEPIQY